VSFFWVIFTLAWSSYAAFIGLTGFLLYRPRGPHLIPFLGVSVLIVVPTLAELLDQNAYVSARGVLYWLSMSTMTLLLACWLMSRRLPAPLAKRCRNISGLAFLAAVFWSVGGPGGFFLPLLFFPDRNVLAAHLVFFILFSLVALATFLGLHRFRLEGSVPLHAPPIQKSDPATARKPNRSWRLSVNVALALLLLFWLAQWIVPTPQGGLVSSAGERGMSPDMLNETEVLCSGHFSQIWQPLRWCWHVQWEIGEPPHQRTVPARRKVIPFLVDHYWKGSGPHEIEIALFEPSEGYWSNAWQLPSQENLLVALTRNATGSGTYRFVNQANSWSVIAANTKMDIANASADKVVESYTYDYLQHYAEGPEAQRQVLLSDPLTIDSIAGLAKTLEINNVSVVGQALATARNFRMEDENTIALLKRMLTGAEPHSQNQKPPEMVLVKWTTGSPVRQDVLATLMKLAPDSGELMAWLQNYNAHPSPPPAAPGKFATIGDETSNFPWELARAIEDCDHPEKMMPLITQALSSPNPRMREEVARALAQRQSKDNGGYQLGNQLGNRVLPLMVKLLDDPDPKVQRAAMSCIFWMSGEVEKRPDDRDITIWATLIYEQNPGLFPAQLVQYKAWWEKEKDKLSRTQTELDQIREGLIDYAAAHGNLQTLSDPREFLQILHASNGRDTPLIALEPWELNSKGEPVDAWGTRIRISLANPKNPRAQSAGLDKKWDTADDLTAGSGTNLGF
jgi:HEAT repeat protein